MRNRHLASSWHDLYFKAQSLIPSFAAQAPDGGPEFAMQASTAGQLLQASLEASALDTASLVSGPDTSSLLITCSLTSL